MAESRTSDAVRILRNRYTKGDPDRAASVDEERVNAQVAGIIYDLRTGSGLTQKELADLVGTTQSVISRLEDSDYEGHSLSMLNRIADVFKRKVTVSLAPQETVLSELDVES